MKKTAFLLAFVMFTVSCLTGCEPPKKEVEPYDFDWDDNGETKIIATRISAEKNNDELDISDIMADFNPEDGSFRSIDYLSEKKDTWYPAKHLDKLLKMQIASHSPGNKFYGDEKVKEAVTLGVNYWAQKNYFCEWNGWWNTIGTAKYIPDILLYGVEGISDEVQSGLLEKLKSNDLFHKGMPCTIKERKVSSSSGNLTDEALSMLKIAVIENDGNTIMWLKSILEREVQPFPTYKPPMYRSDADGIKEDMSILEHWHLLYFGGYGEVFTDGMNRYIKYTKNTQYELSNEALDHYSDFILDGMQYACRNGYRDISASGRGVARVDALKGIYGNVKDAVELLLGFDSLARTADLESMMQRRFGDTDKGAGGHKYFYESDYGVYNNENYMATVRHSSKRTRVFEVLNDENPLGYYTGMGAAFYYINGDEYYNILPLYDWNKIPGTTVRQGYLPMRDQSESYNEKGSTNHTAGVSDSEVGASYISLNKFGVKLNQAYFMFDAGVKCLGNNISSSEKDEIVSTVNQTRAGNEIITSKDGQRTVVPMGTEDSGVYSYIYNNGISYISDSELTFSLEHKDGDWKTINTRMDPKPVSGDLLTVYISHGAKPKKASYDYTVLMNTTPDKTEEYIASPELVTIANNKDVQAVYDSNSDILEAVFYKKAEISLPDGRKLSADGPCLIILREGKELTAASHNFKEHNVRITFDGNEKKISVNKKSQTFTF